MPENDSDFDNLLAQAQEEIASAKSAEEEKKQEQEAKIVQLISDLDMRWKQVSSLSRKSITPFVSDLKTEVKSIDSLGFSSELMDSGDLEKNEVEKLEVSFRKLRDEFFKKEEVVTDLLGSDLLSDDKKEEIKKAWEISSAEFEAEKEILHNALTSQQREMSNKKGRYKEAQKTQDEFNDKYRYDSKINGSSLFEKLLTEDTDLEWFFENLLTDEERLFIKELREKQKEEEDVLSQKNIFDAAKLRTKERVTHEIDTRLEKTLGAENVDELLSLEIRDEEVFDTAKKYIIDTIGEGAWGDLYERAKEQSRDSKDDIQAWQDGKKGFGKNTSANRKKRLIDTAEPLRKEVSDTYSKCLKKSDKMHNFLYELDQAKYLFEDNYDGKKLESMKRWEDGAPELQAIAHHIYETLPKNKILEEIYSLEKATFLDADKEHSVSKELEKLQDYLSDQRNLFIKNLKVLVLEKRDSLNETYEEISDELKKFPDTPTNYYSKEEKED